MIVDHLREQTKTDFRRYRKNTMNRRIHRRMGLAQLTSMQDYLLYLRDNPQESAALKSDLLIGVTRFFRNPEAWELLEKRILQPLVVNSRPDKPIRIWCAGCATGEEVYSLAMLCQENSLHHGKRAAFQIFASDVSHEALETARAGLYPESVVADVSKPRLQQFFHKEGHYFQITRQLRESIVFAEQNVLAHPPFSQLDLIVCRNLLIYLERSAQQRVLDVFQFALKEGGGLFLGSSESTGDSSRHFSSIDKRWRLFRRTATASTPPVNRDAEPNRMATSGEMKSQTKDSRRGSLAALVQRQFVRELEMGVAVVNGDDQAVYLQGPVDQYLQVAVGELGGQPPGILGLVREGLRGKLREVLRSVRKSHKTEEVEGQVRRDGRDHRVRVIARPLRGEDDAILLSFLPATPTAPTVSASESSHLNETSADLDDDVVLSSTDDLQSQNRELEHELAAMRQQLSTTIEDLETANEELKALNEESMAVNEELQAGNEELETSKEELQSLNEELVTLNNQLELKLHQLQETTDDLNNLLLGSHLPTIFVDTHYRIRRFTPSSTDLFHLIASDTGRLLSDIRATFETDEVFALAREVLESLQPQQCSVETTSGKSYIGRLQPYRSEDNHIRGVVMTFADVTELRKSERLAQSRLAELKTIYESTPIGLSFIDKDFRYRSINRHLADVNGVSVEDTLGRKLSDILPDPLLTEVQQLYQQVFDTGEPIDHIEVTGRTTASDELRYFNVSCHPVRSGLGEIVGINSVVEDVTDRKRIDLNLRTSEERLRQIADTTDYVFWVTQLEPEEVLYVSPAFEKVWGLAPEALRRDPRLWTQAIHQDDALRVREAFERWVADPDNQEFDIEYRIVRGDGAIRWIGDRGNAIHDEDGALRRVAGIARDITESIEAANKIEQAEVHLRAFLNSAPVMMGMIELPTDNSDVLHVLDNRATEDFLNFDVGDTAGKWASDLGVPQKTRDAWIARYRESQKIGEPLHFIVDYDDPGERDADPGKKRWLNATVCHLGPGDDGRERFCYVFIDDTQRVRAEIELEKSQRTLVGVVHDSPFGVYLVDSELTMREVSRGAEKAFESVRPVIGRTLMEVMHAIWPADFAEEVIARFRHTLETGEPYETTETTEQRDDINDVESYHWQLQRISLPDEQHGVVCYFYDLTPIKNAEFALRESEGQLRLAVDLAKFGVIKVDYQSDEATLDSTAAAIFNLPPDLPVPRSAIYDRVHPDDRELLLSKIQSACRGANSGLVSTAHRIVHEDGSTKWLDLRKRVYFSESPTDTSPTATHSIEVVVDITDRKEYEEKLQTARKQAEAANRARGEFLANMSHEIRTPMTAILGYADMLGEHLKDPDNKQCVNTIQRNGRFLLDILNDILDLSKIDAGKMELDRERISPQSILADVISLMNVRAEEKQIHLAAEFHGEVPETIETDGTRLRQILLNLVGNAIKFTSEGSVSIRSRFNQGTGQLEFEVTDTGIGIEPDRLEGLFEPFTQIDASNTRSFGGTGLGLAISRRLAQMLGGDIYAKSELGRGSSFTVTLDPGSVENVKFRIPNIVDSTPNEPGAEIALTGRVLIVDDRRDILFLAQNFIEQAGATVITAGNGQEGVDRIMQSQSNGERISVVLMDMQMPIMDGYTASRTVRNQGINLPIIALTANAMSEDREKCLEAGCTDFLTKPLDKRSLLEMIAKYGTTT
nr:CheR family methyltransferase [Lignipirellula cremea]